MHSVTAKRGRWGGVGVGEKVTNVKIIPTETITFLDAFSQLVSRRPISLSAQSSKAHLVLSSPGREQVLLGSTWRERGRHGRRGGR